jgi:mannose-6-phosphate isomerase-like protein (cupin superfamily)
MAISPTPEPASETPRVIHRGNAPHYTWGERCDGWHLVRRAELSVIAEEMPPGTAEVEHHHAVARQFFYVCAGETVMKVEGHEFALAAGDGIEIAPGWRHQIFNRSDRPARFIVVSHPPSHGDRVLESGEGSA